MAFLIKLTKEVHIEKTDKFINRSAELKKEGK